MRSTLGKANHGRTRSKALKPSEVRVHTGGGGGDGKHATENGRPRLLVRLGQKFEPSKGSLAY